MQQKLNFLAQNVIALELRPGQIIQPLKPEFRTDVNRKSKSTS